MIEILHICKDFVVCIKPSGYLSEFLENSNISLPKQLIEENNLKMLYTVHRLDKEVEGIMVYARTENAAAELSRQILDGRFEKKYIAAVKGHPQKDTDVLCDLLFHDKIKNKTYVVKSKRKGVKEAKLEYQLISYSKVGDFSLLSIKLYTGRTHQIRVQLSSRGLIILGDKKYGSSESVKPIMLYSYELSFYDLKGHLLSFSSMPSWASN